VRPQRLEVAVVEHTTLVLQQTHVLVEQVVQELSVVVVVLRLPAMLLEMVGQHQVLEAQESTSLAELEQL
jgi:hypothetical protein